MSAARSTARPAPPGNLLIRGAHLIDPRAGLDRDGDLLVRDGEIAEVGEAGALSAPDGAEVVDAEGLHALPAFVDPHVHLRTPGREDEEDIDSGTRAAAAGGFCAILAMPNTDPVVDTASVLSSLRQRARARRREYRSASPPRSRAGRPASELTEMAELADEGAAGFTDDGLPVRSAGVMRQALQYQRLAGRTVALHEEDPTLSGNGVMHEGAVSALLGLAGIPAVSRVHDGRARLPRSPATRTARIHIQHVSARETVEAIERAKAAGVQITCRGHAAPPHAHRRGRARRSTRNFKMNPPLRSEDDRQALIEALRSGVLDCIATDHAPHAREEKEQPFEAAPMGVTGLETAFAALHTDLVLPGADRRSSCWSSA